MKLTYLVCNTLYFFSRSLFPGKCGYKSETGGILKNLRESISHEKVKSYHDKFYRAENLHLIVTGIISPEEIIQSLEPIEQKILKQGMNKHDSR